MLLRNRSLLCFDVDANIVGVKEKKERRMKFHSPVQSLSMSLSLSLFRMTWMCGCIGLVLLVLGVMGQKLPTRDEGLFQMQIRDKALFHDSSVLPDGAEISGYLFKDTPKRWDHASHKHTHFSLHICSYKKVIKTSIYEQKPE